MLQKMAAHLSLVTISIVPLSEDVGQPSHQNHQWPCHLCTETPTTGVPEPEWEPVPELETEKGNLRLVPRPGDDVIVGRAFRYMARFLMLVQCHVFAVVYSYR